MRTTRIADLAVLLNDLCTCGASAEVHLQGTPKGCSLFRSAADLRLLARAREHVHDFAAHIAMQPDDVVLRVAESCGFTAD